MSKKLTNFQKMKIHQTFGLDDHNEHQPLFENKNY